MTKVTLFLILLVPLFLLGQKGSDKSIKELHRNLSTAKTDAVRIKLFLDLADYHIDLSNQVLFPKSADSAFYYVKKGLSLSEEIKDQKSLGNAYIVYSKIYKIKGDLYKSKLNAEKAIDVFTQSNDKNNLADAYMALMHSKSDVRSPSESLTISQKALKLYKESGNKEDEAKTLTEMAFCQMSMGKMKEGKDLLNQSLKIYNEIGFEQIQEVYGLLCVAETQLGDYKQGLDNALKMIKLIEKFDDESSTAAEMYNFAAMTYHHLKDIDNANRYFQKAYEISKKYNDKRLNTLLLGNIVETFTQLKKKKEALAYLKEMEKDFNNLDEDSKNLLTLRCLSVYSQMKDLKSAEKYAKRAIAKSDALPVDHPNQNFLYPGILPYLFASKEYGLTRKYLNRYEVMAKQFKNKRALMEINRMQFQLDSIESKFDSALEKYKLQQSYRDSLYDESKNKEIAELQIKYETEKKDKDILLKDKQNNLLKEKGELQESKLSKALLLKNISFGSLILFLIIIILLFISYRIKQKTNRILESQKTEINQQNLTLQKLVTEKEWLLKEIHHRVKNNLQMVMSLLNAQSYYLKDNAAMTAIRESQHRIHSMSLIHKKLYQSENVVSINMEIYIKELVEYFKTTFDLGQRIQFTLDIDQIELFTSQAVPLGLILNECITNSIKHAFSNNDNGAIIISFKNLNNTHLRLSVKDNGNGIADDLEEMHFQSLGMKLIKGFSDDLDGTLVIKNENGLSIYLEFLYNEKITEGLIKES